MLEVVQLNLSKVIEIQMQMFEIGLNTIVFKEKCKCLNIIQMHVQYMHFNHFQMFILREKCHQT